MFCWLVALMREMYFLIFLVIILGWSENVALVIFSIHVQFYSLTVLSLLLKSRNELFSFALFYIILHVTKLLAFS